MLITHIKQVKVKNTVDFKNLKCFINFNVILFTQFQKLSHRYCGREYRNNTKKDIS